MTEVFYQYDCSKFCGISINVHLIWKLILNPVILMYTLDKYVNYIRFTKCVFIKVSLLYIFIIVILKKGGGLIENVYDLTCTIKATMFLSMIRSKKNLNLFSFRYNYLLRCLSNNDQFFYNPTIFSCTAKVVPCQPCILTLI